MRIFLFVSFKSKGEKGTRGEPPPPNNKKRRKGEATIMNHFDLTLDLLTLIIVFFFFNLFFCIHFLCNSAFNHVNQIAIRDADCALINNKYVFVYSFGRELISRVLLSFATVLIHWCGDSAVHCMRDG